MSLLNIQEDQIPEENVEALVSGDFEYAHQQYLPLLHCASLAALGAVLELALHAHVLACMP
jgi:hypothetical protein